MSKDADADSGDDQIRPIFAAVGERIMMLRKRAKLTQTDLAKLSGMSKPYIVEVENHGANLSLDALCRLAKALGVGPGSLFPAERNSLGDASRSDKAHAALNPALEAVASACKALALVQDELMRLHHGGPDGHIPR